MNPSKQFGTWDMDFFLSKRWIKATLYASPKTTILIIYCSI
jgi:hypothetical protein